MMRSDYINMIAPLVCKYAKEWGYKYPSAIIGQAILESGWGQSTLAAKYNNHFGMKCGGAWKGKSVNMNTKEEYTPGVLTPIKDNFRVYDSLEEGIEGYFKFLNWSNYRNLKNATSSKNYLELIKQDGYATSSNYVENVYRVVTENDLLKYDNMETQTTQTPAEPVQSQPELKLFEIDSTNRIITIQLKY